MNEQLNARNIQVLADAAQRETDRTDVMSQKLETLAATMGMMQKKIQQIEQRLIMLELAGRNSGPTV